MSNDLNIFEQTLHKSSNLVKKWGVLGPPDDKSLRELLTINEISVWDVMAVELALYHIPNGLAEKSEHRTLRQILTSYLRPLKYALRKTAPIDTSDCGRWPSGNTALFLGFTGYLARDVLQPVVDMMLREDGLTPVFLTENVTSSAGAATSTHSAHSAHRHRCGVAARDASEFTIAIRRVSSILTGDDRYRHVFEDERRQLWPLIKEGVLKAFHAHAVHYLPETVAIARHILTVHRPAIIVSIDVADPRTRTYTQIAKALGIPSVQVQAGPVSPGHVEWRFLQDELVAAQGDISRDVLISHGVTPDKIFVTGSPRYDGLSGATDCEIRALRERFAIPQANRIVVLASSYAGDHIAYEQPLRSMNKAMFAAVAKVLGVTLIVKPHPLVDGAEMRAMVADFSRVSFAKSGEDIRALIRSCDALFTFGSTATFDGLVLGKPTACIALPGWSFSDWVMQSGAVMALRSEQDIVAAMREIVADGGARILQRHAAKRSEYLSSTLCEEGQGATRRIVDLLNAKAKHRYERNKES